MNPSTGIVIKEWCGSMDRIGAIRELLIDITEKLAPCLPPIEETTEKADGPDHGMLLNNLSAIEDDMRTLLNRICI